MNGSFWKGYEKKKYRTLDIAVLAPALLFNTQCTPVSFFFFLRNVREDLLGDTILSTNITDDFCVQCVVCVYFYSIYKLGLGAEYRTLL